MKSPALHMNIRVCLWFYFEWS